MKRVLIVEDDADINKALTIRLQAAGYEVHSAADAYVGLSLAVQVEPDVMLLDISMPAGDGFSIVERMRENTSLPDIPFIMLTASKRPEFRRTARELGAVAYFEKPYEAGDLLEAVEDAMLQSPRFSEEGYAA